MTVKSYYRSIELNNEGCLHLEYGKLASARNCFREALQSMTEAIVEIQEDSVDKLQTLNTGERHSYILWSALPHKPLHVSAEAFIYQRAVVIHRNDDDNGAEAPPPCELSDQSSMIVYNLGLTFHLIAVSANKAVISEEAMGFYRIAEAIRSRRGQHRTPELLDLAIYNNMGQIELEVVNYDRARMYFRALKDALVIFCREGLVSYIPEQDSNGFVLNASMPDVQLAAAA